MKLWTTKIVLKLDLNDNYIYIYIYTLSSNISNDIFYKNTTKDYIFLYSPKLTFDF